MKHMIAAGLLLGAGAFVACNSNPQEPDAAQKTYEVAEDATVLTVTGMT
jgi:hypothetical protein